MTKFSDEIFRWQGEEVNVFDKPLSISKVLQLVLPSHMLKKFGHNSIFFAMFVDKKVFFPLHVFGRVKICPFAPNVFNLGVNQQAGERVR